jgi:hypothetical protein
MRRDCSTRQDSAKDGRSNKRDLELTALDFLLLRVAITLSVELPWRSAVLVLPAAGGMDEVLLPPVFELPVAGRRLP